MSHFSIPDLKYEVFCRILFYCDCDTLKTLTQTSQAIRKVIWIRCCRYAILQYLKMVKDIYQLNIYCFKTSKENIISNFEHSQNFKISKKYFTSTTHLKKNDEELAKSDVSHLKNKLMFFNKLKSCLYNKTVLAYSTISESTRAIVYFQYKTKFIQKLSEEVENTLHGEVYFLKYFRYVTENNWNICIKKRYPEKVNELKLFTQIKLPYKEDSLPSKFLHLKDEIYKIQRIQYFLLSFSQIAEMENAFAEPISTVFERDQIEIKLLGSNLPHTFKKLELKQVVSQIVECNIKKGIK